MKSFGYGRAPARRPRGKERSVGPASRRPLAARSLPVAGQDASRPGVRAPRGPALPAGSLPAPKPDPAAFPRAHPPSSPPSPRYLDLLEAVVPEAVQAQRAVGEAVPAVGQAVEQAGHGGVLAAGVESQSAVRLREQPRVVLPGALRGPGGLLVLVQRAERRVRVGQVRVSGLLALRVGQRRLRVWRGEVGRLEVGGGRVAERRSRAVGRLVESGQLRQAGPGRRPGQPLGAVLRRRRQRR